MILRVGDLGGPPPVFREIRGQEVVRSSSRCREPGRDTDHLVPSRSSPVCCLSIRGTTQTSSFLGAKIFEEDEDTGAKRYKYIRTGPDHFSLAFTYAWMAAGHFVPIDLTEYGWLV